MTKAEDIELLQNRAYRALSGAAYHANYEEYDSALNEAYQGVELLRQIIRLQGREPAD